MKENKEEILNAAISFLTELISLWNKKVVEFEQPEQKISKEELYEELKKDIYEI